MIYSHIFIIPIACEDVIFNHFFQAISGHIQPYFAWQFQPFLLGLEV